MIPKFSASSFIVAKDSNIAYPRKMVKGGKFKYTPSEMSQEDQDAQANELYARDNTILSPLTKTLKSNLTTLAKAGQDNVTNSVINGRNLKTNIKGASAVGDILPYASNIVNSFRKLPNPIMSQMESTLNPNLVSYDAERNNIDNSLNNANKETDYKVSNPAVAQAIKATTLGQVIKARNELGQNEANQNAQIKTQTQQFNTAINARNIARQQEYNDNLIGKKITEQNLQSDNLANFGDKYQEQKRDKSLMDLEDRKLDVLPSLYKDTGIFDRNYAGLSLKERYKKAKMGGKITK